MTVPDTPVRIEIGFEPEHRAAAANLYWDAFGLKLEHAIGPRDRGIRLIEQGLDPARAVSALQDDDLVGLAGFSLDGRALVRLKGRDIIKEFGLWSGLRRTAWASLLHRKPAPGVLLMDGIVVRTDRRGHGVGTELLTRLFGVAREHGKSIVRLDVVDTNPAAHRLYLRMGFVEIRNQKVPFLRRAMGFSAAKTMERRVG
ncbi:MAG: GNAT family N-acetyltransferase [Acidimicrobiia bacterium]